MDQLGYHGCLEYKKLKLCIKIELIMVRLTILAKMNSDKTNAILSDVIPSDTANNYAGPFSKMNQEDRYLFTEDTQKNTAKLVILIIETAVMQHKIHEELKIKYDADRRPTLSESELAPSFAPNKISEVEITERTSARFHQIMDCPQKIKLPHEIVEMIISKLDLQTLIAKGFDDLVRHKIDSLYLEYRSEYHYNCSDEYLRTNNPNMICSILQFLKLDVERKLHTNIKGIVDFCLKNRYSGPLRYINQVWDNLSSSYEDFITRAILNYDFEPIEWLYNNNREYFPWKVTFMAIRGTLKTLLFFIINSPKIMLLDLDNYIYHRDDRNGNFMENITYLCLNSYFAYDRTLLFRIVKIFRNESVLFSRLWAAFYEHIEKELDKLLPELLTHIVEIHNIEVLTFLWAFYKDFDFTMYFSKNNCNWLLCSLIYLGYFYRKNIAQEIVQTISKFQPKYVNLIALHRTEYISVITEIEKTIESIKFETTLLVQSKYTNREEILQFVNDHNKKINNGQAKGNLINFVLVKSSADIIYYLEKVLTEMNRVLSIEI